MEKVVWTGTVYPGKMEVYQKRHDQIWPEMRQALCKAGVQNYTIWSDGKRLIGYYECEDREQTEARKSADPVFQKWKESMEGVMRLETGQGGLPFQMIFSLEEFQIEEELMKKQGE